MPRARTDAAGQAAQGCPDNAGFAFPKEKEEKTKRYWGKKQLVNDLLQFDLCSPRSTATALKCKLSRS